MKKGSTKNWLAKGAALLALGLMWAGGARAEEMSISRQLGILYLPVQVMEDQKLIEKHAAELGVKDLTVRWLTFGGGGAQTDALLSGNVDIVNTGTGNLLLLWDRTKGRVKGVIASSAQPVLLLSRDPAKKSLADYGAGDKIAVPTVKVSTQAILLQMAARKLYGDDQFAKFDPLTVQLGHVDAMAALSNPTHEVANHFSAPPYQYLELKAGAHQVISSTEIIGGPLTQGQFFTRTDFADAHPKLIDALKAATVEAIAFIKAHPDQAMAIYKKLSGDKASEADLVALLKEPGMMDFETKPQGTMKFAEHLYKIGTIKTMPKAWSDYYLPSSADLGGN